MLFVQEAADDAKMSMKNLGKATLYTFGLTILYSITASWIIPFNIAVAFDLEASIKTKFILSLIATSSLFWFMSYIFWYSKAIGFFFAKFWKWIQ